MHYQIIYYKVISNTPVTVSGSQVRKETGRREVCDSIDDVITDRISFGASVRPAKLACG